MADERSAGVDEVLRQSPVFAHAHLRMNASALAGGALSRKTREFVLLAANLNATHVNTDAAREHMRRARAAGASDDELREVIQCASLVGIHAVIVGLEPLQHLVPTDLSRDLTPGESELKRAFEERRRYWSAHWEQLLRLDSDYFSAVLDFSAAPAESGALSALDREYVYIAFDCSPTHMFEPGLELHMRTALELGASSADLLSVLKLVSSIGFEAAIAGYELLAGPGTGDNLANE
ncbi:carboxymuconolactone decarboxylase family protein [Streptomyces tendae]|uniref:carboxymuconolactone decarboxylase family protein n=1 Tax=Streptomyces tendae TaxID=1932 RepID=UPI0036B42863